MTEDQLTIIMRIANGVAADERAFQRGLGGADRNWNVFRDALDMLLADERPAVNLPARMIRNPSTTTE
jgi:hypothetical protein